MRRLLAIGLLCLPAWAARGDTYVWIDANGVTHITDDRGIVPDGETLVSEGAELGALWEGDYRGPAVANGDSSHTSARGSRLLRGAIDDLRRGETARAAVALESVLRVEPGRAEAHWYLALLERQRGRFGSAEKHLQAFLASAGEEFASWRASAERRLRALDDERRLADPTELDGPLALVSVESPHFWLQYDEALESGASDYASSVLRYLEDARDDLAREWGVVPSEATGVVLYGKAAYLRAHSHRFSFETVGFFDGRIHVVSAAHPSGELRSLLFHEYTHALFRERTGGHRPFWLNEGLAEIAERRSRGQKLLSRGERFQLQQRIESGNWIPLARLAPSFAGLSDDDARAAYLEATAAVEWILERTDRATRRRLLDTFASGADVDGALATTLGIDQHGVDTAVRESITAVFPADTR